MSLRIFKGLTRVAPRQRSVFSTSMPFSRRSVVFPRVCHQQQSLRLFSSESREERPKRPVSWGMVAATAVVCGIAVTYLQNKRSKKMVEIKSGRVIGRPKLGGPYDLIDSNGEACSDEKFRQKYQLIYFGFINCPDICPTELRKLEEALRTLEMSDPDLARAVVPVFISVDPLRDTPQALHKYSKDWDPRIVWLTGATEQIAKVAKSFRVYFSIPEIAPGDDDDYLVDHSIFFYLMDRNHKLLEIWGKNTTAQEMALGLKTVISQDLMEEA